jgi:hypothetical protein
MKNKLLLIPLIVYIPLLVVGIFCIKNSIIIPGEKDTIGLIIGVILSVYCGMGIFVFSKEFIKS